jgi:hypothetical protein
MSMTGEIRKYRMREEAMRELRPGDKERIGSVYPLSPLPIR